MNWYRNNSRRHSPVANCKLNCKQFHCYRPLVLLACLAFVPSSILISADRGLCLMSQDVPSADSPTANPTSGAAPPTPGGASSPASSEVPPDESSPDAEAAQTTSHDNPGMATPLTDDTDS